MKLVAATTNPGKIAELRAMLEGDIEWPRLSDLDGIVEIEEDGETFAENARKKALGYAEATGLWIIADDSGLVVDALGGKPGVESARFSQDPRHKTQDSKTNIESQTTIHDRSLIDHRNIAKVLKLLEGVPTEKRTAKFVCCLCLASPERILIETEGMLEGFINDRPLGENGFGYDPIFFVPNLNETVAQLSPAEKNAISHRGNAVRKLKPSLEQLLKTIKCPESSSQ